MPDLLDLVAQGFGDLCMSSFIVDKVSLESAVKYMYSCEEYKNDRYAMFEIDCQDAIDAYNQGIDDAREAKKLAHDIADRMFDPHYKYAHFYSRFNQAEIDAGFSGTGREFC